MRCEIERILLVKVNLTFLDSRKDLLVARSMMNLVQDGNIEGEVGFKANSQFLKIKGGRFQQSTFHRSYAA